MSFQDYQISTRQFCLTIKEFRLLINKIHKSRILNLYFKNGYDSIFSLKGISMGSGRKCSQSLKNSLSMNLNAVPPLPAESRLSECFLQQLILDLIPYVLYHTALENKTNGQVRRLVIVNYFLILSYYENSIN